MPETTKRVTFFSKKSITCPVCETSFFKEDLLTGGVRMIAGNLTDELRRLYEPSKKYGELYPLIYTVIVCPSCYYAAYAQDFLTINADTSQRLQEEEDKRKKTVSLILKDLNFTEFRDLKEGAASYYLAIMCYEFFSKEFFPTLKCGLSALRAAWLFGDLHRKDFGENYDYLSTLFYRKARFFYISAVEKAQNGLEPLGAGVNYGPDLDKNYAYDGFLYITGLLESKYGPTQDSDKRMKLLEDAKRMIAKLFGSGKASKSKPSAILDKARDLYDEMNESIKELKGEG